MKKLIINLPVPKYKIIYIVGNYEDVAIWIKGKIETADNKQLRNLLEERLENFIMNEEVDSKGHRKIDGGKTVGLTIKLVKGQADLIWINTRNCKTKRKQLSTVVHENRHIADHIEKYRGIHDSEFFAYLEGYLYEQIEELVNKKEEG